MQARDCIAAKMPRYVVFGRMEEPICRHREEKVPGWFQSRMDELQSSSLIFDMFQHIEEAYGSDGSGREIDVLQPSADHGINSPRARSKSAIDPGLDQSAFNACRYKSFCNVTVAAANIKEHTLAMEATHKLYNHPIAVPEPE